MTLGMRLHNSKGKHLPETRQPERTTQRPKKFRNINPAKTLQNLFMKVVTK